MAGVESPHNSYYKYEQAAVSRDHCKDFFPSDQITTWEGGTRYTTSLRKKKVTSEYWIVTVSGYHHNLNYIIYRTTPEDDTNIQTAMHYSPW